MERIIVRETVLLYFNALVSKLALDWEGALPLLSIPQLPSRRRPQAEMVQFHERQRRQTELDAMRDIASRRGKPLPVVPTVMSAAANADSE